MSKKTVKETIEALQSADRRNDTVRTGDIRLCADGTSIGGGDIVSGVGMFYPVDNNGSSCFFSPSEVSTVALRQLCNRSSAMASTIIDMGVKLTQGGRAYEGILNRYIEESMNKEHRQGESMVRVRDGVAIGVLSSSYSIIDDVDVFRALGGGISKLGECEVEAKRSPTFSRYRITFPGTSQAVSAGDDIVAGIDITNSECGLGSVRISPMVYRLICSNGLRAFNSLARYQRIHMGSWSEDNDAFLSDVLAESLAMIDGVRELARTPVIMKDPKSLFKRTAVVAGLPESKGKDVFELFSRSGHGAWSSAWDIVNWFTLYARDLPLGASVEVETAIGSLMSASAWDKINGGVA